jgi:hypothetical protein
MQKLKPGDLVAIQCDDIEHLSFGWESRESAINNKPNRYHFVGWLLKRNKRFIHITAAVSSAPSVNSSYRIPIGKHTSIVRIKA